MIFSILIPNYNNYRYLKLAIASVKKQSFEDYEIIVCDQSNDGSEEQVAQLCTDNNVVFFHLDKPSLMEARSTLVFNSKGQYILWLDSDDLLCPFALELIYQCIVLNKNPEMIFYGWKTIDENNNTIEKNKHKRVFEHLDSVSQKALIHSIKMELLISNEINDLWNKCFLSTFFKKHFVENSQHIGEDFFIVSKMVTNVSSFSLLDAELYSYRINPNSVTHIFKNVYWNDHLRMLEERLTLANIFLDNPQTAKEVYVFFVHEIYALVLFASKNKKNFRGTECKAFKNSDIFLETYLFIKRNKKLFTKKERVILFLFKHKMYLLLFLIKLFYSRG